MIPSHVCLVGTSTPSGFRYYGSILQMGDSGQHEEVENTPMVPRLLRDIKNEVCEVRLQSRPALVPYDLGGFTVLHALAPPVPVPLKKGEHGAPKGPVIPAESSTPTNHKKGK